MGKTNKQKMEQRTERLSKLPRSERLAKSAMIKKKEGRVLDSSEKHALKMTSEYGEIMRLWEQLRTLPATDDRKHKMKTGDSDEADGTPAPLAAGKLDENGSNPKFKVVKKLYKVIFPKFDSLARTPKVSRVLQSCIKYGSTDQLMKLSTELAKEFVTFCTDAYAHHVVCAMFRHVPHALYTTLLKLVLVNMPSLITHKFGMLVVNAAYTNKLCSQADRNMCVLGVYKDSIAVMKGWPGFPVLEDILAGEGDHKKRLVENLFKLVDKLVSQKEAYDLPIVQRMVSAFIRYGNKSEVMEMCITLKPHITKLMITKEGSELASLVFSLLQPKSRKEVLRSVYEQFMDLAMDKHAAPVVARMFDLVYDGQLLYKYLSSKMIENLPMIMRSPYAHLILLHLLTPDELRKRSALFPNWFDYNLYSSGNPDWNIHNWLDDKYEKETVEICSKDAQKTHVSILPPIIRRFFEFAEQEGDKKDFPKHFVGRVAKEIHYLVEEEPLYKECMAVTASEMALLDGLLPKKMKREDYEGPNGSADAADGALEKKRVKKEETPAKKAATPAKSAPVVASPKAASSATKKTPVKIHSEDAPLETSARKAPVQNTPTPSKKQGTAAGSTPGSKKKTPVSLSTSGKKKLHKKFSE